MENLKTFDDLVAVATHTQLYTKLVEQLNKDMSLANVNLEFEPNILPTSLKLLLHEKIVQLVQEKFRDYLNLLYIVDVSEDDIRALDGYDVLQMSENVTFLILKREWQKVYYKTKFPS